MSHARPSLLLQALCLSTDTPTTSSPTPPQEPAPTATACPPPTMTPTDWPDEAEEIISSYRKMREVGISPLPDGEVPDDVFMGTEEDIRKWRLFNQLKKRGVLEDSRKPVLDYFGVVEREEEEEEGLEEAEDDEDGEEEWDSEDEDLEDEDLEEDLSDLEDLEKHIKDLKEHIEDLEKKIKDLEEHIKDLKEEDDSEDNSDLISDPEDFFIYNDSEHHANNNDDYISDIVEGHSDYELHIRNVILALDERIHVEPLFLPWATILSMAKRHASLLVEIRDAYHAKQQQDVDIRDAYRAKQQQQQQQDRLDRSNAEPGAAEIIRRAVIATASNAETMRLVWEYRARLRTELQEACRAREVRRNLAELAETAESVVAWLGLI